MQITGLNRGPDPIKNSQLAAHISQSVGEPISVYVTPDEAVVWGATITEEDRDAIQTALDTYQYIPTATGATGPRGAVGSDGKSAYEVWLDQGNVGEVEDYLNSLEGMPGATGPEGPEGPEGPKGDTGDAGLQGPAGNNGAQGIKGDKGDTGNPGTTSWNGITDKPASFNPSAHSHTVSDTSGLQAALDAKAASSHTHTKAQVTDFAHTHPQAEITNLVSDLAGKASTSHNHDGVYATAAHTHAGLPSYALLANGATAMGLGTTSAVKVTPTATATYTTTVPPAGALAQIIIVTSGITSRTITFGTGFKSVGTLATGTTTARVFVISWVSDGTNLYETGRTAAMVA